MVDSLEGIPDVEPGANQHQVAAPDNDFDGFCVGKGGSLDLGSSVAIRVGSSPTSPTIYVSAERRFSFSVTFLTSDHAWITRKKMGIIKNKELMFPVAQ